MTASVPPGISDEVSVHPLTLPEGSPLPRIRLVEFDAEDLIESEIDDPSELLPYAHTDRTTWIDIQGLGDEARLRAVAQILGIHDLALYRAILPHPTRDIATNDTGEFKRNHRLAK